MIAETEYGKLAFKIFSALCALAAAVCVICDLCGLEAKRPAEKIRGDKIPNRVGVQVQPFRIKNNEGR